MSKTKVLLVAFVLVVTTLFVGLGSIDKASAASFDDPSSIANEVSDIMTNTVQFDNDDYVYEDGLYTKTLEGGDYTRFYVYTYQEPTQSVTINGEPLDIYANKTNEFNIENEETVEIAISEADFDNINTGIKFKDSQDVQQGLADGINYSITYEEDSVLGKIYHLNLSAENGEMLKINYNPDIVALDEVYVDGISEIDENAILIEDLTVDVQDVFTFVTGDDVLSSTVSYEVIDSNFNVTSYEMPLDVSTFKATKIGSTRMTGFDHGDAPSSYGSGEVYTHDGAQFMNFYHISESAIDGGYNIDKTPSFDVDDDEWSPSATAFGDTDDELGYVTATPDQSLSYTVSDDPSSENMAYIYPMVRSVKGQSVDVGIWVDYDGNGTFDEDEGTIVEDAPTAQHGQIIRYPIDLDEFSSNSVEDTYLRMRVMDSSAHMTAADADTSYGEAFDGETEDHALHIARNDFETGVCYSQVDNDPAWAIKLVHNYGPKHKLMEIVNGPGKGSTVDIESTGGINVALIGVGGYQNVNPSGLEVEASQSVEAEAQSISKEDLIRPYVGFDPNSGDESTRDLGSASGTITIKVYDPEGAPIGVPFTWALGDIEKGDTISNIDDNTVTVAHTELKQKGNGSYEGTNKNNEGDVHSYLWGTTTGGDNEASFKMKVENLLSDGLVAYNLWPLKTYWATNDAKVECPEWENNITTEKSFGDSDRDNTVEPNEENTYTISVTNESSTNKENVIIKDDLLNLDDDFSLVYDLSNPKSIDLDVSSNNTPAPSTPTLQNLMGTGVSLKLDAGETATISFTLNTLSSFPDDIDGDGDLDEDITNVASVTDSSNYTQEPSVTVPIDRTVSSSLTKDVSDSSGNNEAENGEYLTYTINVQGLTTVNLVDDIDENLDLSTIDLVSVTENGTNLGAGDYSVSVNESSRQVTLNVNNPVPGATYEITYDIKVSDPLVNDSATLINNYVEETVSGLDASVDIPLVNTVTSTIEKTITDDSGDGKAQPGERLEYTITYTASVDKSYIIIEDLLTDPNIVDNPLNIAVYEDSTLLTNGTDYNLLTGNQVYINDVKAGSTYKVVFNVDVQNPLVDETRSVIENTATELTDGISDDATIDINNEPLIETAEITKIVEEASTITNDGDGKADLGETLHYEITFQSDVSGSRHFIDQLDEDLDISTITNFAITVDGTALSSINYTYTENASSNTFVVDMEYTENTEVVMSFDIQVVTDFTTENKNIVNSILESESGVNDKAEIEKDDALLYKSDDRLVAKVIGSDSVNPGDEISYSLTVLPLQAPAETVRFVDNFDSQYLSFVSVDGVYLDGTPLNSSEWSNASTNSIDVTVNHDFSINSEVKLEFTAKLDENTPKNITVGNKAVAYTDEAQTNYDDAEVATSSTITLPSDSNIYSEITVTSERGGAISGQVEANEEIKYEISVDNLSDSALYVQITDDLEALSMDEIFSFDGSESVTIESNVNSNTSKTLNELMSGFTYALAAGESIDVSFTLDAKSVLGSLDVNPIDGSDDLELLNTASVKEVGKDSLYPGKEIGLPSEEAAMDLIFLKTVDTHDMINGTNFLSEAGGKEVDYTLTVVNKGTDTASGVHISDDLLTQGFENIYDIATPENVPLTVSSGNGTITTANPTLKDLMSSTGVEVEIPASDSISVTFTLTSKAFEPTDVSEVKGEELYRTNTATLVNKDGNTLSSSTKVYFTPAKILNTQYEFFDANEIGFFISGMPMTNEIAATVNDDLPEIDGYISYDTDTYNSVRYSDFDVYLNNVKVEADVDLETIEVGTQSYATFSIKYDFEKGDEVKIVAEQTMKTLDNTAKYGERSLTNMARLYAGNSGTNVLYDEA